MTKTFMLVHTEPPIIASVNPITSNIIQDAHGIRFYYKGGGGIVLIEKETSRGYNVYIPPFSSVVRDGVHDKLNKVEKELDEQIKTCGISDCVWFMFDVETKQIVSYESFIDFIPYYGISKAVFVIDREDGSTEPIYRFLSNTTPYGVIQFLPLVIAKKELLYPNKLATWSNTGKKLLSFLVSERTNHPADYRYQTGHWDSVTYMIKRVKDRTTPFDVKSLNVARILEKVSTITIGVSIIQGDIDDADDVDDPSLYEDYYRMRAAETGGMSAGRVGNIIMLTHLLDSGVERFFRGEYTEMIDVEIDTQKETFKSISIDPPSGIVFVETVSGIELGLERVKEMLQTERVQLLNDLL